MYLKHQEVISRISKENIHDYFHIKPLSDLVLSSDLTYEKLKKMTQKALLRGFLSSQSLWDGAFFQNELRSGCVAPVYIQKCDLNIGWGVFAREVIPSHAFIGQYCGVVRKKGWLWNRLNDYCFSYPVSPYRFRTYTIDALCQGNETRFINHSDQPNCETLVVIHEGIVKVIIRALRTIRIHEQLTIDYGEKYWTSKRKVLI